VRREVVFTTHTPVPAATIGFPAPVEEHLGPLRDALGLDTTLMALARTTRDDSEGFCMTVLALKMSSRANAVSSLHGQVSRAMWRRSYPAATARVPIGHITNGVHVQTWLAPQMRQVYDRHLGPDWPSAPASRILGARRRDRRRRAVGDALTLKKQLIEVARRLARARRTAAIRPSWSRSSSRALSFDALTIGFARAFATYKRANLILRDIEQLAALVNNAQMPIQFVFAGKSHPLDGPGKRVLQEIARLTQDPRFVAKIVFVEDYDINVGRHLVQGVDVWLNCPRRPLEACGTSGQKGRAERRLELSVLDGWWAEAYDGLNGFAIGTGESHTSNEAIDTRDAEAMLRVLHEQVIPLYYNRMRMGCRGSGSRG
jgi:starch phosphorylase